MVNYSNQSHHNSCGSGACKMAWIRPDSNPKPCSFIQWIITVDRNCYRSILQILQILQILPLLTLSLQEQLKIRVCILWNLSLILWKWLLLLIFSISAAMSPEIKSWWKLAPQLSFISAETQPTNQPTNHTVHNQELINLNNQPRQLQPVTMYVLQAIKCTLYNPPI